MNERVKQLALECYNPYSNFDHEKFAELIVRACAKRSEELGQPELGKGLMKHFGVEE
jgi:hypothetical protein